MLIAACHPWEFPSRRKTLTLNAQCRNSRGRWKRLGMVRHTSNTYVWEADLEELGGLDLCGLYRKTLFPNKNEAIFSQLVDNGTTLLPHRTGWQPLCYERRRSSATSLSGKSLVRRKALRMMVADGGEKSGGSWAVQVFTTST